MHSEFAQFSCVGAGIALLRDALRAVVSDCLATARGTSTYW